ncbi:hypothetical protein MMC08_007501, partial [Hypocenomyce scalaris]|nr:hypothetical protein [Hypocenomyce scalaris]
LAHQNQYTVLILRQNHTWSPLRSDLELTTRLLSQLDVFPPFMDLIHAFGYRSDDVGDDFQGYYHASKDRPVSTFDILNAMVDPRATPGQSGTLQFTTNTSH